MDVQGRRDDAANYISHADMIRLESKTCRGSSVLAQEFLDGHIVGYCSKEEQS